MEGSGRDPTLSSIPEFHGQTEGKHEPPPSFVGRSAVRVLKAPDDQACTLRTRNVQLDEFQETPVRRQPGQLSCNVKRTVAILFTA